MTARTRREQAAAQQGLLPSRRGERHQSTRIDASRRGFATTLRALEQLADTGAQVSLHVRDLDRGHVVVAGDDFVAQPIGGVGVVAVLLEVAVQFDAGTLDANELVDRSTVAPAPVAGLWNHLAATNFTLADVAVLAAATGDPVATNALLARVGTEAVRARLESLGLTSLAVLDGFRDDRGPDHAPDHAVGSTRETAGLFAALVNSRVVAPAISAQVAEWLSLNQDLSLVASATGLDPFDHENDKHRILFINKTGRADGVRAEAGVLAGPRAGVAYAITVCFDDLSIGHRLRVHDAMRTFGIELMEYVF